MQRTGVRAEDIVFLSLFFVHAAVEGCQKKITDTGKGRIANEGPIFLVFTLLPVPVLPVLSTSSAQANGFFLGSILRSLSALEVWLFSGPHKSSYKIVSQDDLDIRVLIGWFMMAEELIGLATPDHEHLFKLETPMLVNDTTLPSASTCW